MVYRTWQIRKTGTFCALKKKSSRTMTNIKGTKCKNRKRNYFFTQNEIKLWNLVIQAITQAKNFNGFQRDRTLIGTPRLSRVIKYRQ